MKTTAESNGMQNYQGGVEPESEPTKNWKRPNRAQVTVKDSSSMSEADLKLNQYLWDYVHKLEFILTQTEDIRKRDQKLYTKKINLSAQYLDSVGISQSAVQESKYCLV